MALSSICSSCSLAWRFWSARTSSRTYSLALLYAPALTCSSTNCFIGSGREIFIVCIRNSLPNHPSGHGKFWQLLAEAPLCLQQLLFRKDGLLRNEATKSCVISALVRPLHNLDPVRVSATDDEQRTITQVCEMLLYEGVEAYKKDGP